MTPIAAVALAAASAFLWFAQEAPPPDPVEQAYNQLKAAQEAKDADKILRAATAASEQVHKAVASTAPADEAEKETWTKRVAYAKEVGAQIEYALYTAAIEPNRPPAQAVALFAALEKHNPKAKYLGDGYGAYLYALSQSGQTAQLGTIADKALVNFPNNVDLLSLGADQAMAKQQRDKAANYAERLITALGSAPKTPASAAALTRAQYIAGVSRSELTQYPAADRHLRAALPNLTDPNMKAAALFHLGLSNYQIGKATNNKALMLEAAKYSDQCAAMKTPFSQQAWKNAALIKQEAARLR